MTLPITLLIPIMAPLPMDHALRELQDKALEELRLVPSLLPLDSHLGDSCIRIRVIDESAQEPLLKDVWKSPSQVRQYRFLVIEADGHKCAENLRRDADASEVEKLSAEEFMWFSHQYAITCVQLEANTILLLANVIHPGALSADVGYTFIHEKQYLSSPKTCFLQFNLRRKSAGHHTLKLTFFLDGTGSERSGCW